MDMTDIAFSSIYDFFSHVYVAIFIVAQMNSLLLNGI